MKKMLLPMMVLCSVAAAAEEWIWLPDENIISNSVWSIKAFENSGGTLTIGVDGVTDYQEASSAAFTGRGAGTLDLNEPVVSIEEGGARKSWTITHFQPYAFSRQGFQDQPITKFVFPVTTKEIPPRVLTGFDTYKDANGTDVECTALTNIVMVVPECTGNIGDWAFCREGGLRKPNASFTIYAPKVIGFASQSFNCGTDYIDYSDWYFPSATWIGGSAFAWNYGKGTKKFESVLQIDGGAFQSSSMRGLEFGRNWTLKDNKTLILKNNCIVSCGQLRDITFGAYSAYSLQDNADVNAFKSTANFTNVVFEGRAVATAPAFLDALLVAKNPITSYGKANQVVIYASRNLGWQTLAKPATSEELAKRPDFVSNDDCMGVYETADGKRKAWLVHKYSPHERFVGARPADDRFADHAEFVSGTHADDCAYVGDEVTIRAVCGDETKFNGWKATEIPEGAVIDGDRITFVITQAVLDKGLRFNNSPKWTYLPDEGVISNRIWKLNVTVNDMPAGSLRLGLKTATYNTANSGNAFTGTGEGILDLSGEIKTEGGERYVMTHLGPCALAVASKSPWMTNYITRIVVPRETVNIGYEFCRSASMDNDGESMAKNVKSYLEEIVIDVPDMTGNNMGSWSFARHSSIKSLYVNAPKVEVLADQCFNNGGGYDDLSLWHLDSVYQVSDHSLGWFYQKSYGHLKLPKLRNVLSHGMVNMQSITALDLGTAIKPEDKQGLSLAKNAMQGINSVTNLVLGAYVKLTKTAAADMEFKSLQSVWFMGPLPENVTDFVDSVLYKRGVPSDVSKYAVIRASANLGWRNVAKPVAAAESAAAAALNATLPKGEQVIGVYENASGQRVAWLVHKKSPYDPKGTTLIIR